MGDKTEIDAITDDEYAALAASYEADPPRRTGPAEYAELPIGRPPKGAAPGRTPVTSIRLPNALREQLDARARAEDVKPAEVMRRALVEYLARHPA